MGNDAMGKGAKSVNESVAAPAWGMFPPLTGLPTGVTRGPAGEPLPRRRLVRSGPRIRSAGSHVAGDSPANSGYLPSQTVPLSFCTGTPTALPYSVHEPS